MKAKSQYYLISPSAVWCRMKRSLRCEWDVKCLPFGVMPLIKPAALLNQSLLQRSAHCSHYSAREWYAWISPTPLLRPHLPPSPPSLSLSHPLSCAQQLTLSSAKKTAGAAPQSGTPVPKADPDGRDPVTHLGSFYFEAVKGDGDGSSCDLQFTTVWTF